MGTARVLMRAMGPLIDAAARLPAGRALLLTNLRSTPWLSSEAEARAMRAGFAHSRDFWQQLWWTALADVPAGLGKIDCPVILAQGTVDVMASMQTPRYLALIRRSRFQLLIGAGHDPLSDAPHAVLRLVHEATAATRPALPAPALAVSSQ